MGSNDRKIFMLEFQDDFLDRLRNHLGLFLAFQRLDEIEVIHGDLAVPLACCSLLIIIPQFVPRALGPGFLSRSPRRLTPPVVVLRDLLSHRTSAWCRLPLRSTCSHSHEHPLRSPSKALPRPHSAHMRSSALFSGEGVPCLRTLRTARSPS